VRGLASRGRNLLTEMAAAATPARKVTGTFVLFDDVASSENNWTGWVAPSEGRPCQGKGGYSDINTGTEVRLKGAGSS